MWNILTTFHIMYTAIMPINILMPAVPFIRLYTWYKRIATSNISITSTTRMLERSGKDSFNNELRIINKWNEFINNEKPKLP